MSHAVHDKRSLLMHRLIARRLRHDPALRAVALENIQRWNFRAESEGACFLSVSEWVPLLQGPLNRLLEVMTDPGDEGQRMRQSSPFAGEAFIHQAERMRVLKKARK
jgi:hypothetical protein